jgi:hypothetical protein
MNRVTSFSLYGVLCVLVLRWNLEIMLEALEPLLVASLGLAWRCRYPTRTFSTWPMARPAPAFAFGLLCGRAPRGQLRAAGRPAAPRHRTHPQLQLPGAT